MKLKRIKLLWKEHELNSLHLIKIQNLLFFQIIFGGFSKFLNNFSEMKEFYYLRLGDYLHMVHEYTLRSSLFKRQYETQRTI